MLPQRSAALPHRPRPESPLKIAHHYPAAESQERDQRLENNQTITSIDDAVAAFERLRSTWLQAPCRRALLSVVEKSTGSGVRPFSKAILFVPNVLTVREIAHDNAWEREWPLIRLAVFLDVVNYRELTLYSLSERRLIPDIPNATIQQGYGDSLFK